MKFSYVPGELPFVEVTLSSGSQKIVRSALVDSGSTINVLPYEDGLDLGLVWDEQMVPLKAGGVLSGTPMRAVLLEGKIGSYPPVKLGFAWTQRSCEEIRLILGQTNFFQFFDVSFKGKEGTFTILPNK